MTGKLFKIIGAEKPFLVRYSLLHYNKTLYYQKNCQTMSDMAQKLLVDCKFAEDMNHIHLPHLQLLSYCLIIKNFLRNLDSLTHLCIVLIHPTIKYQALYPPTNHAQPLVIQGTIRRNLSSRGYHWCCSWGRKEEKPKW